MTIGIVGSGVEAAARVEAVRALPEAVDVRRLDAVPDFAAVLRAGPGAAPTGAFEAFLEDVQVVFVAVPTAQHYQVAAAATKRGRHVFLEWPPATSARECEAVVHLAEEAGVEAAVSRPLRFHADLRGLPAGWRANLIVLRQERAGEGPAPAPRWPRRLADAADLCCTLARSHAVQRVDAEMVPGPAAQPEAIAFGLRFHSGTYAQVSLRRGASPSAIRLYAAGPGCTLDVDLSASSAALLRAETHCFLRAIQENRPVPVSALDGLHTMRLLERIMARLR